MAGELTTLARWRFAAGAAVAAVAAGLAGVAGVWLSAPGQPPREVIVPALTPEARAGQQAFDRRCAVCHGDSARGSAQGPPLVHALYRPAHHADIAFELAVRRGVAAHHWRFGNMPAQEGVSSVEVAQITRYVRELQQANGIR